MVKVSSLLSSVLYSLLICIMCGVSINQNVPSLNITSSAVFYVFLEFKIYCREFFKEVNI
jgi:hypothetical protein